MRVLSFVGLVGMAAGFTSAQTTKGSKAGATSKPAADPPQQTTYIRPNFHERFDNYRLTTFGPLQMAKLGLGSAISQAHDVPPEWGQGWAAYGRRFASDVGSSSAAGTTNFLLSEALGLDTAYYPCDCKRVWPRLKHALVSSVTARAGYDGHRVFSVPAVVSPYAGALSTLAWYPARYRAEDAFRTGNYDLLDSVGTKIALEFLKPLLRKIQR